MKNFNIISCFLLAGLFSCSSPQKQVSKNTAKPKLVVGIVVDQMRPDYLIRYQDHFTEGGFKRILKEGFYNKNTHYNYIPTYTGPGHASVYTGTTPAVHGIIANNWYDQELKRSVYCAEDTSVNTVGSDSDNGEMSPHRMLSTTITDELRLKSNFQSKVVGVAIKDRGSILPAGHTPTGSFWYDKTNGKFISSTYYSETLPEWVDTFNAKKVANQYLDSTWNTLFPIEEYLHSTADDMPFEAGLGDKESPTFPYNLKELRGDKGGYGLLPATPYGNSITTDMALAAIEGEEMGADEITDFLALSYSSTDYVGHGFGPRSIELEDTYIRLDREIERLLNTLDKKVGKGNYTIFITADHAVAEVPAYMQMKKIPADYYYWKEYVEAINKGLSSIYGKEEWVEYFTNEQVILDKALIASKKIDIEEVRAKIVEIALTLKGVAEAYSASDMQKTQYSNKLSSALQMGYNFRRSGDVLLVLEPGWFHRSSSGTTHGSGYNYDTHVPLLWYGAGIPSGESYKRRNITDIAPTLAFLLETGLPNGATGSPILEILE